MRGNQMNRKNRQVRKAHRTTYAEDWTDTDDVLDHPAVAWKALQVRHYATSSGLLDLLNNGLQYKVNLGIVSEQLIDILAAEASDPTLCRGSILHCSKLLSFATVAHAQKADYL